MLKGKLVNLTLVERGDLSTVHDWFNDPDFVGEHEPFRQESLARIEKQYDVKEEHTWFFIQKKDGARVGYIEYYKAGEGYSLGYTVVPGERGKSYGGEAVRVMVDYLFLHKSIIRIQAEVAPANAASQRVLEKAGFTKEGVLRKSFFSRGVWRDSAMYSILREEWKGPQALLVDRSP